MNEPARLINGALLRQRREGKGWAQTDLATRACLSLRQVRQIEDGGNSSFYSESVKATHLCRHKLTTTWAIRSPTP
jgi:transcriptional regulator with XRE-family HTH domain